MVVLDNALPVCIKVLSSCKKTGKKDVVVVPLFLDVCSLWISINMRVYFPTQLHYLHQASSGRYSIRITKQTFCKFIISAVS